MTTSSNLDRDGCLCFTPAPSHWQIAIQRPDPRQSRWQSRFRLGDSATPAGPGRATGINLKTEAGPDSGVNEVLCGKRLLAIGLSYAGLAGPGPDSEKCRRYLQLTCNGGSEGQVMAWEIFKVIFCIVQVYFASCQVANYAQRIACN